MSRLYIVTVNSPLGGLVLGAAEGRLCLCDWVDGRHPGRALHRVETTLGLRAVPGRTDLLDRACMQLEAFFAGGCIDRDVPLRLSGTTFQCLAWQTLQEIPRGETRSYAQQAMAMGRPSAVRAVAAANAANPLSIFVPCHRVIASDGRLAGYGGGPAVKQALLALESD